MQEKIYPNNDKNTDLVWDTAISWPKHIPQTKHSGTPDRKSKQAGFLMTDFRNPSKKPNPPVQPSRRGDSRKLGGLIFVFSEYYYSNLAVSTNIINLPLQENRPKLQLLEDILKPANSYTKLDISKLRKDGNLSLLFPWENKFHEWLKQKSIISFKTFCGAVGPTSSYRGKVDRAITPPEPIVPEGDYNRRNILIPALFSDYNLDEYLEPEKLFVLSGTVNLQYIDDIYSYSLKNLRFPEISKHFNQMRIPEFNNVLRYTVDVEAKTVTRNEPYVVNYKEEFIGVYFEHCFPAITDDNFEDPYLIEINSVNDDGHTISFNYVYGTTVPARNITQTYQVTNYLSCFAQMKGRLMNNDNSQLFIPNQRIYKCTLGSVNPDTGTIQIAVLGTTRSVPTSYIDKVIEDSTGNIYIEDDWTLTFLRDN